MVQFRPKLMQSMQSYSKAQFGRDLSSGITVGVLALPLAMAFAIASGVSPSAGIWTAIVAGFIVSAFGGSLVQIGGPTGAFIPILFTIAARYGVPNMLAATFLAGVLLVVMGALRMGNLIRFIPVTVVIGFTNGIAVVIGLSQVKDFFGLEIKDYPAEFFGRMESLWHHIGSLNVAATGLALGTVVAVFVWDALAKKNPRFSILPAQLVGLLAATLVGVAFSFPVETIGTRFGGIPQTVPTPAFPLPSLDSLGRLLAPAITIALLGAIESLLSARVVDAAVDDRHDPNQELLAQGIANIASPFFGGIAATGAIARTATNVKAGGRTPVAGIIHSLTLLIVVLAAAPLAAYVPIPVLAGIVMVTAIRMGEWHEFSRLTHFSWNYRIILLTTFALTVLFDLTIAVEIGMVLASLFFIYRVSDLTTVEPIAKHSTEDIAAYSVRGSLFFGSVGKLDAQLDADQISATVVILEMHAVINIDTTGIDWLRGFARALEKKGSELVLCALEEQPASLIRRSGLATQLGVHNVLPDLHAAVVHSREILDEAG